MKVAKRSRKGAARVDVPGREYAIFAAHWFPELGFDHPYSRGKGDMDVPPKYRERIDGLLDGAVIPPEPKAPYSEGVALAFGLPADKIEADRRKYEAPELARSITREAERARQQMLDALEPVRRIIGSVSMSPKLQRGLIASVEAYAQAAFEYGLLDGRLQQRIFDAKQHYVRVDAAAATRIKKTRPDERTEIIRKYIEEHPKGRLTQANYTHKHGEAIRVVLKIRNLAFPSSPRKREEEVAKALRSMTPE